MKTCFERNYCLCLALIVLTSAFALMPNTTWNWMYDYFVFLPWWQIVLCVLVAVGVLFAPKPQNARFVGIFPFLLAAMLWYSFIIFSTSIHCFGGDGAVGTIPTDVSLRWDLLKGNLPWQGRLDTYGTDLMTVLGIRLGFLQYMPGMTIAAAEQLYCYFWGFVFLAVALLCWRKRPGFLAVLLTLPFIFNFFGNVDSYPFPLAVAIVFLAFSSKMLQQDRPTFFGMAGYGVFWLFCGWVHPLAGVVGFLPAIVAARWWNGLHLRVKVPEWAACLAYCVVFFTVIELLDPKGLFTMPPNEVPPILSDQTVIHLLNCCILPLLPLALWTLLGEAPRKVKSLCSVVCACQLVCFLPAHYTQGVNDQFPYMLYFVGLAMPWLLVCLRYPLRFQSVKCIVALNLLLLVPMVAVHSTERTVARAQMLFPIDPSRHNKGMGWQMHLGLVLADCLRDYPSLKPALLQTFSDGMSHAPNRQMRTLCEVCYIGFHYHYGDFMRGRVLLRAFLLSPQGRQLGYFMDKRPCFTYMNRERLWDDVEALTSRSLNAAAIKKRISRLRDEVCRSRYCFINPSYAVCPY